MNSIKENLPAFIDLETRNIKLFDDLEVLGLYCYVKMMLEHETSTLAVIIDRIKQKFDVDEKYILALFKIINDLGLFMVAKEKD